MNRPRGSNTIGISLFSYLCSFLYASFIFSAACLCEAGTRAPGSSRLHSYCLITSEERDPSASINKENPRGEMGMGSNEHPDWPLWLRGWYWDNSNWNHIPEDNRLIRLKLTSNSHLEYERGRFPKELGVMSPEQGKKDVLSSQNSRCQMRSPWRLTLPLENMLGT